MTAENLIAETLPPLKMSDTGNRALAWMNDFQVRHLPLVDDNQFKGLITEDDIYNFNQPEKTIAEHPLNDQATFARANEHIYEVVKTVVKLQLTAIPVVNAETNYLGVITLESLLKHLAQSGAMTEPGTILEIEIPRRDYSMVQIAQIVESENTRILSSNTATTPNEEIVNVTLKLNIQNPQRIISNFNRYGYDVKAHYQEADYIDTLQERYNALMSYLNV